MENFQQENNSQIQNAPECITFSKRGSAQYQKISKAKDEEENIDIEDNTPMKIDDCEEDLDNSDQRYFEELPSHRGEQTPINLIKQMQNINTASLDLNRTNLTSTEVLLASKENQGRMMERNEILFKEKSSHKEDNAQAISIIQEMKNKGEIRR